MKKLFKLSLLIISLLVLPITLIPDVNACTRVVYKGLKGTVLSLILQNQKKGFPLLHGLNMFWIILPP